jgi:hypothetical protein
VACRALHYLSALAFVAVALLSVDCARSKKAYPKVTPWNVTLGIPTAWPSYDAEAFNRHGRPLLTTKEKALIILTLAKAEPCQRALLRYAFPRGRKGMMVLFFQAPMYEAPHVLWAGDEFYKPTEGAVFPLPGDNPDWNGIQWDVDHTKCRGQGSR